MNTQTYRLTYVSQHTHHTTQYYAVIMLFNINVGRELVNFGNEPNPQIFVFIRNSDTIGNMLRIGTTLGDIANKLRKYLSDAQFSNIANASSQHAHICMTIMLDEIKAKIRADPKNWRVFIDEVLGKIEPAQFTAGLIAKLGMVN